MSAAKLAQALLIPHPRFVILVHHELIKLETRGAMWVVQVHFFVEEIGISGVEKPLAAITGDSHTHMAECVPNQWDHGDIIRHAIQGMNAVEPEPGFALARIVDFPVLSGPPLLWAISLPVQPGFLHNGIITFGLHHVDARPGKIIQPAGVVEIKVRQHDMPNIARIKPKPLDLPDCRQFLPEIRAHKPKKEFAEAGMRMRYVLQTKTGIHQDKCGIPLDQKAMVRQMPALQDGFRPCIISFPPRGQEEIQFKWWMRMTFPTINWYSIQCLVRRVEGRWHNER